MYLNKNTKILWHEFGFMPQLRLCDRQVRVLAISPGPIKTRAAGGLKGFELLLNEAMERSPVRELVDVDDVGFATAYLASAYARRLMDSTLYVDGGLNIMA